MKRLLSAIGFWLTYPLVWVYLRIGTRTRVLIVVGDSVLLAKGWLGLDQWGLPGGGVHKREDPADGAAREVKEETGISLPTTSLKFFYKARANYKGLQFDYSCYYAELSKRPPLQKQSLEIAQLEWVPLKDVTQANTTAEAYRAVQHWLKR